ncbi:hypothetical protein LINPERPRIM_LOCUS2394, partial [Linum perenne]
ADLLLTTFLSFWIGILNSYPQSEPSPIVLRGISGFYRIIGSSSAVKFLCLPIQGYIRGHIVGCHFHIFRPRLHGESSGDVRCRLVLRERCHLNYGSWQSKVQRGQESTWPPTVDSLPPSPASTSLTWHEFGFRPNSSPLTNPVPHAPLICQHVSPCQS